MCYVQVTSLPTRRRQQEGIKPELRKTPNISPTILYVLYLFAIGYKNSYSKFIFHRVRSSRQIVMIHQTGKSWNKYGHLRQDSLILPYHLGAQVVWRFRQFAQRSSNTKRATEKNLITFHYTGCLIGIPIIINPITSITKGSIIHYTT